MGVRSTNRESVFRRARYSRAVAGLGRVGRDNEPERPERRFAVAAPASGSPAPTLPERVDLDPILDVALYNCSCGFVFEAEVKTAISCPHCGAEQAW
jgi:hypothetical protein